MRLTQKYFFSQTYRHLNGLGVLNWLVLGSIEGLSVCLPVCIIHGQSVYAQVRIIVPLWFTQ